MDIDKLIEELKLDEGIRLKAYTCTAGKRTIGVGRNYTDVPFSKEECQKIFGVTSISFLAADKILTTKGITMEQAEYLLLNDINKCIKNLEGKPFWEAVKDIEGPNRALVNLCFNMGIGTLLTFKNTLAFITKKDWRMAASNLTLSKWYVQVGHRGPRVVKLICPEFYVQPKIAPKVEQPKVEPKPIPKPVKTSPKKK